MLERRTYLIKEQVAFLKLSDTYDIFDPATGEKVGTAREELPGWAKALKLLVGKQLLPTSVAVYDAADDQLVFTIRRGVPLLRAKVTIHDHDGTVIGSFKSKLITLGGAFTVHDRDGNPVAQVKGDWKGWNFKFLNADGNLMGTVTKQWAGLGKEMFTSADNYIIALEDGVDDRADGNLLLLAAGLAIDTVFKEAP
jgi:uncharacterized protein YxjI